jgi:TRAP-type mannitol/chloroaromatic compound transport system substrate-binding protein
MKRRQFLKTAGIGVAAAAVASPAIAQSMPELKWRMTCSWPKSLDTLFGTAEQMAKAVAAATDNKFQIQVFAGGEIVPALQVVDAVQNGTVECGHSASYYYFGKDPTFAFGTSVAFGPNARLNQGWFTLGGGKEVLNEFYKKYNQIALLAGNTGCQMGGWFRKEIKTPGDLGGLNMRIGGFAGRVLQKLGVVPQQMPGGDIQGALEKATLDAASWVGPYDDEKLGLSKVAPYYYFPAWWSGGAMFHNFINLTKWNSLPPAYQSLLRTASDRANVWMQARYDAENPPALKRLVGTGVQLKPFPPLVLEAGLKASLELYAELSAANPAFKKIWDAMLAFRNDQYLWWQLAEYSYDTFLIQTRTRT